MPHALTREAFDYQDLQALCALGADNAATPRPLRTIMAP